MTRIDHSAAPRRARTERADNPAAWHDTAYDKSGRR